MTAFESLRYTLVVVAGPNNEFCWTRVYDSGGGVYCAHAMAAVARHDSMSLLDIDNLLSGMVPELVRKRWILVLQPAPQQLAALRLGCRHGVLVIAEQQSRRCAAGEFAILKRMGKPVTLLEQLCGHAMSFGARSFETERKDGWQRAFAQIDDARTRIANFEDSSTDAKELRANLYAATKKPFRTVIGGKVYVLQVRVVESFGADAFEVSIDPAPKLDPSVVPPFTPKQGQYLAFIYNYTKIHRCPP